MAVVFQRELRGFFEWLYIWGRWSRAPQESVPNRVADQLVEALRVVIRLPGGVEGRQRVRIEESMISRPAALSVVKFTPWYVEFTVQKQE